MLKPEALSTYKSEVDLSRETGNLSLHYQCMKSATVIKFKQTTKKGYDYERLHRFSTKPCGMKTHLLKLCKC